jgi:proteasome assembly chaperone (PAC2) family protein
VLDVDRWPELRDPALVISLTGWVDAGEAGNTAASHLRRHLEAFRPFGRYELGELLDLQQTRPTVELVQGATRKITWPEVQLAAGRAGRDVVLCTGPEPSLRWPAFAEELVDAFVRLDITQAFTLGGMPAVASHRRPVEVLATATSRSLAQEVGAIRTDYRGPTGVQSVLQVRLGEAGIPTVGLWAQVPHYVSASPSPPAVRALLERLRELAGVEVGLDELDEEADEYVEKVEAGLAERPDVADLVQAIEADAEGDVSGDALAAEIERYLRDQ